MSGVHIPLIFTHPSPTRLYNYVKIVHRKTSHMNPFDVALITFDEDTPIFDALVLESYSNLLNVSMHVQLVKELERT